MSATGVLGYKPSGYWYLLAGAFVVAAFVAALAIVSTAPALTSVGSPQFFTLHDGAGSVTVTRADHYGVFINGMPSGQALSVTSPQGSAVQVSQQSLAGAFAIDGRARHLIAIFQATSTGRYHFQLRSGGDITMIIGRLELNGLAERASTAALVFVGLILCAVAVWVVTLTRRIGWQRRANREGDHH